MTSPRQTTALVVESDPIDRRRLRGFLAADGYLAVEAPNAETGLRVAQRQQPTVVVVDVNLPDDDACTITRQMRADAATREATIIAVAEPTELDQLVGVMDAGVDDFVAKPFGRPELRWRIEAATRTRSLTFGSESADAVIAALGVAIEANDPETGRHSLRVGRLAARLALAVGLDDLDTQAVVNGALIHDVGKIGIPDDVLQQTRPLSEADWAILRRHPEIGEAICGPLALSGRLAPVIRHHHERWDGAGYPDRLAGEQIPIGARLVGVVDAFDAMIRDRSYRSAMTVDEAVAEVRRGAGTQFDPAIAAVFLDLVAVSPSLRATRPEWS